MHFRKRKSLLGGLVHLNLSKSGLGINVGVPGANVTLNKKGVTANIGIPGSGLGHRQQLVSFNGPQETQQEEPQQQNTEEPEQKLEHQIDANHPDRWLLFVLCFLPACFGINGIHRLVAKKYLSGFLMLVTFGGLYVWTGYDLLKLLFRTKRQFFNVVSGCVGVFIALAVLVSSLPESYKSHASTGSPNTPAKDKDKNQIYTASNGYSVERYYAKGSGDDMHLGGMVTKNGKPSMDLQIQDASFCTSPKGRSTVLYQYMTDTSLEVKKSGVFRQKFLGDNGKFYQQAMAICEAYKHYTKK